MYKKYHEIFEIVKREVSEKFKDFDKKDLLTNTDLNIKEDEREDILAGYHISDDYESMYIDYFINSKCNTVVNYHTEYASLFKEHKLPIEMRSFILCILHEFGHLHLTLSVNKITGFNLDECDECIEEHKEKSYCDFVGEAVVKQSDADISFIHNYLNLNELYPNFFAYTNYVKIYKIVEKEMC